MTAWGDWNPSWINDLPASEKRAALLDMMRQIMTRYKDEAHIIYWDIVNEAVCDDVLFTPAKQNCQGLGRPEDSGLLKGGDFSSWYPDVADYIDAAFLLAREVLGPNRVLVYNDYGVSLRARSAHRPPSAPFPPSHPSSCGSHRLVPPMPATARLSLRLRIDERHCRSQEARESS